MRATLDCPELERFRRRRAQAPQIVREEMRVATERGAAVGLREIRSRAPGRNLPQAIVAEFNADRTEASITVRSEKYAPIARYQEQGTGLYGPAGRMYEIRPVRANVLRFPAGGGLVFTKLVNHPGVKPHWFFRDGSAAARQPISYIYRAGLGRVTRRLGRTG
jgi:hypothetical protein